MPLLLLIIEIPENIFLDINARDKEFTMLKYNVYTYTKEIKTNEHNYFRKYNEKL